MVFKSNGYDPAPVDGLKGALDAKVLLAHQGVEQLRLLAQ
jgi:hypothetical protein